MGEGVHEAELIKWRVSVGEQVAEHDILAEMETDKALVEVPSPRSGVIAELFGSPGDILKVGQPAWTYQGGGNGSATHEQAVRTDPEISEAAGEKIAAADHREDAGTVVGTMSGTLGGVPAGPPGQHTSRNERDR